MFHTLHADVENLSIDSVSVKVHPQSAGAINIKATPHNSRLTPEASPRLQIFRQLSQKSAGVIRHLELCGVALI